MMNEEIFQSLDKWMRLHGYGMDAESMDTFHCILALLAVLLVAYLVGLLCFTLVGFGWASGASRGWCPHWRPTCW